MGFVELKSILAQSRVVKPSDALYSTIQRLLDRLDKFQTEVNVSLSNVGASPTTVSTGGSTPTPTVDVILQKGQVTLTNAQIKALPTTSIDLANAPGAGKRIVPIIVDFVVNTSAGLYTNLDVASYLAVAIGGVNLAYYLDGTNFLGTVLGSLHSTLIPPDYALHTDVTPLINAPLQLVADNGGLGDFTDGNTANTMVVTSYYVIV